MHTTKHLLGSYSETCKARVGHQILVFLIGLVLSGETVLEFVRQAKVYQIHFVCILSCPHHEVVGLDVSVHNPLAMNVL